MAQFTFTIQLKEGKQYQYTGTIEALAKHLQANQHLEPQVIEDMTRFKS